MSPRKDHPAVKSYGEARSQWESKRSAVHDWSKVEGCLRHLTLTAWNDPRTGRLVFTVESVSQWPKISETVGATHLLEETGPFASEVIYRLAASVFRAELESRYGPLK